MATNPTCITNAQICNNCFASQTCTTCTSGGSGNPCSAFCNVGCNTICVTCQTFCQRGGQTITSDPDVGDITTICVVLDQHIHKNWTAVWWNNLRTRITAAYAQGAVQCGNVPPGPMTAAVASPNQGIGTSHPAGSLITAALYNQIAVNLRGLNANVPDTTPGAVIKHTHSLALQSGFRSAQFGTTWCDVCNAGVQNRNQCNCQCACQCSCQCSCGPCSCPCSCGCGSGGRN